MAKKRYGIAYAIIIIVFLFGAFFLLNSPNALNFIGLTLQPIPDRPDITIGTSILYGYDYEATREVYNVYWKNTFSSENLVKFAQKGKELIFYPINIRYTNSEKQMQPIATTQDAKAEILDKKILYENAFAEGIDVLYEYSSSALKQKLLINEPSKFFVPDERILANNPEIEIEFALDYAGKLEINGKRWDKKTTKQITGNLNFEDFYISTATLTDHIGNVEELVYEIKKSGEGLFVIVKIPYDSFQNANFPIEIDTSIVTEIAQEIPLSMQGKGLLFDLETQEQDGKIKALLTCKIIFDNEIIGDCERDLTLIKSIELYSDSGTDKVDYIAEQAWQQKENYDNSRKGWVIMLDNPSQVTITAKYGNKELGFIESGISKSIYPPFSEK